VYLKILAFFSFSSLHFFFLIIIFNLVTIRALIETLKDHQIDVTKEKLYKSIEFHEKSPYFQQFFFKQAYAKQGSRPHKKSYQYLLKNPVDRREILNYFS